MAITVELTTQPQYPGKWTVMDDGLCYSRHDTKLEATNEAEQLAHLQQLGNRVEELLDFVHTTIMSEFDLDDVNAHKAMQEYNH